MSHKIKSIYKLFGQYEKVVNIGFKRTSDCYKNYGEKITGYFAFSKKERSEYQSFLETDSFPDEYRNVRFRVLLKGDLSVEKINNLLYKGIPTNEIQFIFSSKFSGKNDFIEKGTRSLPPSIEIKVNDNTPEITELGFLSNRLKKGEPLLASELDKYAALMLVLMPDKVDSDFRQKYIINPNTNKPKNNILKHELFIRAKYVEDIPTQISNEEKNILDEYANDIKRIVENELMDAGISKKKMYNPSEFAWLFTFLMQVGYDFEPRILLYSNPLIYLNFKGLLHVLLRHVDLLQVGSNYKGRSTFRYKLKDIDDLLKEIVNHNSENIERHFKNNPNTAYRNKSIYIRGDYYTISIEGDGKISSIHKVRI